jgi:hypothetical protein
MIEFLKKLLKGNGVSPSDVCLKSFNQNFKDTLNPEWFLKENHFEAIFYKENLEHIALFSLEGELIEYRLNLPHDYLPQPIKKLVADRGEIMSSVMRNKGNLIEYEIIVRDADMLRHMITISDIGKIIEEQKL